MLLPEIVNPASQAPAGGGMNARYNRHPPTGLQSEQWTMSRKQQNVGMGNPSPPLKQSIVQLRGQIQALQTLQSLGGIDPAIQFSKIPGLNAAMMQHGNQDMPQ